MLTVKKTKGRVWRDEVPLPLEGPLAPFTKLVLEYLELLSKDAMLFKIGRHRAWQITQHITGKWNHYFRSQSESYYGKLTRDLAWLRDFVNVERTDSFLPYVKKPWRDYREGILKGR